MRVISRHRLPSPYRAALTVAWVLPVVILFGALLLEHGFSWALLDARLWLLLGALLLPGCYIWQEGVDILAGGIRTRIGLHQIYPYSTLSHWQIDTTQRLLRVWDQRCNPVIVRYLAHFSDARRLLTALDTHIPNSIRS